MWRNPPYRWRPASWNVGKKGQSPSMVVVRPSSPRPVVVTQEKSGGSIFAVILGVAAVAFGVMELTGVTHVFTPAPKPPVAPTTPAAPGAVPASGATPAPGTTPPAPGTTPPTAVK
jgi:hypothetical protein